MADLLLLLLLLLLLTTVLLPQELPPLYLVFPGSDQCIGLNPGGD